MVFFPFKNTSDIFLHKGEGEPTRLLHICLYNMNKHRLDMEILYLISRVTWLFFQSLYFLYRFKKFMLFESFDGKLVILIDRETGLKRCPSELVNCNLNGLDFMFTSCARPSDVYTDISSFCFSFWVKMQWIFQLFEKAIFYFSFIFIQLFE